MKGKPGRDPRFHCVSIVYLVKVAAHAKPKAGDDAASAEFYKLKKTVKLKKAEFAFDHHEILLQAY